MKIGLLAILACLVAASPALAHKLYISAQVEGTTIRGKAYFRGGAAVQKAEVTARDAEGRELGRTTTNEQGEFSLEAHSRRDHILLIDTGDGHGDEYTVRAAQLPASLGETVVASHAPATPVEQDPGPTAVPGEKAKNLPPPQSSAPAVAPTSLPPLNAEIDELRREVKALREQLDAHDQQTRVRDILGGIGYIVGATGVAYYVLGMRRKDSRNSA